MFFGGFIGFVQEHRTLHITYCIKLLMHSSWNKTEVVVSHVTLSVVCTIASHFSFCINCDILLKVGLPPHNNNALVFLVAFSSLVVLTFFSVRAWSLSKH